jgi:hypothetical protein
LHGFATPVACRFGHELTVLPSADGALAQVIATGVSNASARHGVSIKDIGERLGLSAELISKCKERFDKLVVDGEWEQLYEDRGAVRTDLLPPAWKEFALLFWTDDELLDLDGQPYGFVRYSERAKDQIRDPANRTSKETFRIGWLEARVGDMHEAMKKAGKAKWPDFHLSQTVFSEMRPFYIKDATRETCMCIYHMRFDEMCSGLITYRRQLREHKITNCSCCVPENADEFRKALVCPRASPDWAAVTSTVCTPVTVAGSAAEHSPLRGKMFSYDNLLCVQQQCEECKQLKLLASPQGAAGLCAAERKDPGEGTTALQVRALCIQRAFQRRLPPNLDSIGLPAPATPSHS